MKKIKLLCVVLSVVFLGAVGCSSGGGDPLFDELLPWSQKNSVCSEVLTYEFARFLTGVTVNEDFLQDGESADDGYKLTRSGSAVYTIKEGRSVSFEDEVVTEVANPAHTLIKMEMTVVYKDDLSLVGDVNAAVRNLYEGKTDKVVTYSVLDRYSLASLFNYTLTDIEAQAEIETMSYVFYTDYSGEFSGSRQAVLTDWTGTKKISVKSGTYYDGEAVYFLVRAMRTVKTGSSRGFRVALPFNSVIEGGSKVATKAAVQNTGSDLVGVEVSDRVLSLFDVPESEDENNDNPSEEQTPSLDCFSTSLKLDEDKAGHSVHLYYSAYPVISSFKNDILFPASKVLVKVDYPNHDRTTNAIYNQVYMLTNYSNL